MTVKNRDFDPQNQPQKKAPASKNKNLKKEAPAQKKSKFDKEKSNRF